MTTNFKRIVLLSFLFLLSALCSANIIVYYTYADYKNNTGVEMDDGYASVSYTGLAVKIRFKQNGKKIKIACKDMWGFSYNEILFRTFIGEKFGSYPTKAVSVGEGIVYYENGTAHLEMLKHDVQRSSNTVGSLSFFSQTLSSEMVDIRDSRIHQKKFREIMNSSHALRLVYACIYDFQSIDQVRMCVDDILKEEE